MIYAPTNRRIIRPHDMPSFEHTQRYGLKKGHHFARVLVSIWLMNESSGNKVFDLSGNGNHGTISSGTTWVQGKYGPALDIENTGQPVTLTSEINMSYGTVIVWAKWSGNDGKDLIGKYDGNNRIGIAFSDRIVIEDTAGTKVYPDIPTMVAGQRFCLTVTYDGTDWRTYFNGVESSTPRANGNVLIDTIGNGHSGDGVIWDDDIDMVQIYSSILSAGEIAQIYREPLCMVEKKAGVVYFFVPTGGQDFIRTINDSMGVSDVTSRVSAINRTFSESMGVTDVDSKVSNTIRTIAESLGIIDVLSKEEDKVVSDSLGLTDAVSRVNIFLRTVADSMSITDEVVKVWEVIRLISDSEGITDAYEGVIGQWITIADSLGITDSVTRVIDYLRTQDDDVEITDAIVKVAVALRTIDDSMGITDEMAHELSGLMKAAWAFMVIRQTQN